MARLGTTGDGDGDSIQGRVVPGAVPEELWKDVLKQLLGAFPKPANGLDLVKPETTERGL